MTKGYHITSRSYFLCCLYAFKLSSKFKMNANVACSLCIAHHFHSHTQTIYSLFFFFFFFPSVENSTLVPDQTCSLCLHSTLEISSDFFNLTELDL